MTSIATKAGFFAVSTAITMALSSREWLLEEILCLIAIVIIQTFMEEINVQV